MTISMRCGALDAGTAVGTGAMPARECSAFFGAEVFFRRPGSRTNRTAGDAVVRSGEHMPDAEGTFTISIWQAVHVHANIDRRNFVARNRTGRDAHLMRPAHVIFTTHTDKASSAGDRQSRSWGSPRSYPTSSPQGSLESGVACSWWRRKPRRDDGTGWGRGDLMPWALS